MFVPVFFVVVMGSASVALAGPFSSARQPQRLISPQQRKEIEKALDVSEFLPSDPTKKPKPVEPELKRLQEIVKTNPQSSSAAAALFRLGVLNEEVVQTPSGQRGDTQGAVNAYDGVIKKYGRSPYAVVAMYRKAELLARDLSPDSQKAATKTYERLRRQFVSEPLPVVARDGTIRWETARLVAGRKLDKIYSGKPSYQILNALVAFSSRLSKKGACGLAVIFLTIIVKLLITPLTRKQFQSMKDMQKVQPEVKKLQEKLKGNPQKLNQEVMALYKRHGVNPLGGCFPLIIQMPILIWLYRAIMQYRYQFEGQGFLWVKNLAEPDMPLLVLYLISMIASQKLTTMPTADPQQQQTQKMMMYLMPIMFAFMFKTFPAAFILYWLMFNVLSTVQQYFIMRGQEEGEQRKLGIKTLIPSLSLKPSPKADPPEAAAVQPPSDLDTPARPQKKKRRRRRR